jgi:glycosyltransferase involved in cell wall biosynthesis
VTERVLVVSPYRSEYGPGAVLDHVVQALACGGFEPLCIVPEGARLPPYIRDSGVEVHPISQLSTFPRTLNAVRLGSFFRGHMAAASAIERIASREHAAVIYSTSEAIFCGSLAARRMGLPSIVHAIGMSIAAPRVAASVYIRLLDRLTDQFVCCSSAVAEMFEANGVDDAKSVVVHNGISVDAVDAVSAVDLEGRSARIGMVAAYDPRKGHELFLAAAERVVHEEPLTTFFLIGGVLAGQRESAAFEMRIRDQIARRGLERNVIRTGFIPPPEIYRTMKGLDIVVVPSATEAFAHALLEAMACSRPVVATRIEGNLDALVQGESGLYVDRDAAELAGALLSLIHDPGRSECMGRAGYRRVRELFDLSATLPPLSHAVETLLARRHTLPRANVNDAA